MVDDTQPEQPTNNPRHLIVRLSILPLFILSDAILLFAFNTTGNGCAGTESANFSTHNICQNTMQSAINFDLIYFSPILLVLWIIVPYKKYGHLIRLIILFYILGGRFLLLQLLT